MNSIQTVQFGEITVDPEKVILFPRGLPGFESATRFTLCHEEGSNGIVHFLQSVDDGDLAFSVGEPSQFGIHYQFTLSDEELAELELSDDMDNLLVLILLYRDEPVADCHELAVRGAITSPLVINVKTRKGLQKVMETVAPSVLLSEISSVIQ